MLRITDAETRHSSPVDAHCCWILAVLPAKHAIGRLYFERGSVSTLTCETSIQWVPANEQDDRDAERWVLLRFTNIQVAAKLNMFWYELLSSLVS